MRGRHGLIAGSAVFSRQGQLFTGGPAEGFLQKIPASVRLVAIILLVGCAAFLNSPFLLTALTTAVLVAALISFLDLPSILRTVALPVAILALPTWALALLFFDATPAAAGLSLLRIICSITISITLLHSIGLTHVAPALRRLGMPEELCLAWRMMITQAASFSGLSSEMQLARQARALSPSSASTIRRQVGSQAAILLSRMLRQGNHLAMAITARDIAATSASTESHQPANPARYQSAPNVQPGSPLYQLINLNHSFTGDVPALDNFNTQIPAGGCTALVGANGAGKSTLLHILAGLLAPTSGQLLWQDKAISPQLLKKDATLRNDFRRSIGIVFQDPDAQWLCNTVQEEAEYGPLQIWPAQEARERAVHTMALLGINHLADRPPYTLSGGQKRRVALASVIAMDPSVLLLDEPTLSLDAATSDFLVDWLSEFLALPGKTVILTTHDLALVKELAHTTMIITPCHRLGRIGPTREILADLPYLQQMNLASRRRSAFSID